MTIRLYKDGAVVFEGPPVQVESPGHGEASAVRAARAFELGPRLGAGSYALEVSVAERSRSPADGDQVGRVRRRVACETLRKRASPAGGAHFRVNQPSLKKSPRRPAAIAAIAPSTTKYPTDDFSSGMFSKFIP